MKSLKEKLSIQLAKNPGRIVLVGILLFNILFFTLGALIISALSLDGTEHMSFIAAAYYTITMILDAGCITGVIEDIGTSGVAIAVVCLAIIIIGMITFTGAVIGYVTNFISDFISNANTGSRRLHISNHTVILNWNTRASEIINDLLYSKQKEKVVVLVNSRKEEIKKEIEERLSDTTNKENAKLREEADAMPFFKRLRYIHKHKIKWNITFIVREGDVFSLKQLHDVQLECAKAIIILGSDVDNDIIKHENATEERVHHGNSLTVKTLMQVADITASDYSVDKQKIIVEVTDNWTQDIVEKIIRSKQIEGKCNIVPVFVNQILGQILSQFSLMPELNIVYRDMFSNKGASFFNEPVTDVDDDEAYIDEYISNHRCAIPLASLEEKGEKYFYYVAESQESINKTCEERPLNYSVKVNSDFWLDKKNIIVLGHNSNCDEIMKAFAAFRCEWNYIDSDEEILRVTVVDDKEHLEEMNYYRQYPFVAETVVADIYDKDKICDTIKRVITYTDDDTSILILSDDNAPNDEIDTAALANLIYVQDIINDMKQDKTKPFDPGSIDVVVEIIDPKHHDIVNSYDINNVVISNRYISKMITQIGEKDSIYSFYNDILTYDLTADAGFENKEIYAKKVSTFFTELPAPCKADELIRAVYYTSKEQANDSNSITATIVIGYVRNNTELVVLSGDLSQIDVALEKDDKIIVYAAH